METEVILMAKKFVQEHINCDSDVNKKEALFYANLMGYNQTTNKNKTD